MSDTPSSDTVSKNIQPDTESSDLMVDTEDGTNVTITSSSQNEKKDIAAEEVPQEESTIENDNDADKVVNEDENEGDGDTEVVQECEMQDEEIQKEVVTPMKKQKRPAPVPLNAEDITEGLLIYVHDRRAIIKNFDSPLLYWRYLVQSEIKRVKRDVLSNETNNDSQSDANDVVYEDDDSYLSTKDFYRLSADDALIVTSVSEMHRPYDEKTFGSFTIDIADREYMQQAHQANAAHAYDDEDDDDISDDNDIHCGGGAYYNDYNYQDSFADLANEASHQFYSDDHGMHHNQHDNRQSFIDDYDDEDNTFVADFGFN